VSRKRDDAKSARFEASLQKIADALGKPAGTKTMGEVMQRIGRARQRYAHAAQPEPHQQTIGKILGLSANPGGTQRSVI